MSRFRIAIVGFGKIARDQHAPAIAASPDFDLVAVSNIASGTAPDGVECFGSPADLLGARPDVDAVAICTPPGPRQRIAAQCLEAGKHVLLEKPPAATLAEVSAIAAQGAAAGLVVFASFHSQHNPAVRRAAEILAGTAVRSLEVSWKEDIRVWHPGQDWILAPGGFGVFDPGINAFSILTRILPAPLFVRRSTLYVPGNRHAPIAAELEFTTGTLAGEQLSASLDFRQTGLQTWQITLATADGERLTLTDGGARLLVDDRPEIAGSDDEYPDIYRAFAACLRSGKSRIDPLPFLLVADAFMIGERVEVEPFEF